MTRLRLLFVKQSQNWPRSSGHDVHGYHMMQALIARGCAVSLACVDAPTDEAIAGLNLESLFALRSEDSASRLNVWSAWQRRFTNYFGVTESLAGSLDAILQRDRYDAVVVVARHLLPLLAVVKRGTRIWYPADDPAWHHITRLKLLRPGTWPEAKRALANGLFERAFRHCFDRVWVVSPADRRAVRLITGCRNVDLIPNGVDADHYQPQPGETIPHSCCFWGRLDFGPNVDALSWFLRSVWPEVKKDHPSAVFHVFGFSPTPHVRELAKAPGVELFPDLPDLRSEVTRRQAVVLPFISGGGIKNKLLEAAALGMPIVCTAKALSGTKGEPAVKVATGPREWSGMLGVLWADSAARAALGSAAREWVVANHTWEAAAETACGFATK
jgi:glycosyltransferase involved in cell wall biosynthesis